jgi:hypothetical protein
LDQINYNVVSDEESSSEEEEEEEKEDEAESFGSSYGDNDGAEQRTINPKLLREITKLDTSYNESIQLESDDNYETGREESADNYET